MSSTPYFSYKIRSVPTGQQAQFLESVRTALIEAVRESLVSTTSHGVLDVEAELKEGRIEVRVVDLKAEGPPGGADRGFFNDKGPEEFYNTVGEDSFMSKVTASAKQITPRLYGMFLEAEKAYK